MNDQRVPDAELAIAPGCPHCPAVLDALANLVKKGRIGQLQVINLVARPGFAERHGIRGVPWLRIGPFHLSGSHSAAELERWVQLASDEDGMRSYLGEQLEQGGLDEVVAACRRHPALIPALLDLGAEQDTPYAVRIGVGAVLEDLGPDGLLKDLVMPIRQKLGLSAHPQIRADAAHFLGLTGDPAAMTALEQLAKDPDASVREIANDSMDLLSDAGLR